MEKEAIEWSISDVNLSDIQEYEGNVRDYSLSDLDAAKKSIKAYGLIEPLVLNSNNVLIDGHLRYNAMIELGIDKCKCSKPERELDQEEHAEAYLRKNRNIAGVDDYKILREHFTVDKMKEGGFSEEQIEDITLDPSDIEVDEKPKVYPYEIVFDTVEDKETAEELISRLREQTNFEESSENSLIALIKREEDVFKKLNIDKHTYSKGWVPKKKK